MSDDNAPAVRAQMAKAHGIWARGSAVLRGKNASLQVCGMFYHAVVQSVLLYGSKSCVLNPALLAQLEGFHICAAWRMAREHRPRRGAHMVWEYPHLEDVLEEVDLQTVEEYICQQHNTVAKFIATCPLFANCWEGKRLRGSPRHQFWWEQEFDLVLEGLILDHESDGSTDSAGSFKSW